MLLAAMRRIQLVLDRVDDLEADVLALTIAIQPQHEIRRSFGFLAEMLADINLHDVRFDSVQFDSSQSMSTRVSRGSGCWIDGRLVEGSERYLWIGLDLANTCSEEIDWIGVLP